MAQLRFKIPLYLRVIPIYVVLVLPFIVPVLQRHNEAMQALHNQAQIMRRVKYEVKPIGYISGKPQSIVIPALGIDLPVATGQFYYSNWLSGYTYTVAETSANYAPNTSLPNNRRDKTLIYGHWTSGVFGPTKNLKLGDKAILYTTNHHTFIYSYTGKQLIPERDVSYLNSMKGKPGLVLMTCQGLWAQDRRFMLFQLKGAY